MAQIGKHAGSDVLDAHGLIVVLGACDGQENEKDVIDEERREDHEHRTVELLVAEQQGEERHHSYQRVIGGVA